MSAGAGSAEVCRRAALSMERSASRLISIAFLAGLLFVPVVVATGLLTDRPPSGQALADITVAALRGTLDP